MKKILLVIATLILAITLVACNGTKITAKATISNLDIGPDSVEFDLVIEDENNEIGTTINIYLMDEKGTEKIETRNRTKEQLEENEVIKFGKAYSSSSTKMKEETNYIIIVDFSHEGKLVELANRPFKTIKDLDVDVTTVDQFLKIPENIHARYHLKNDLDFKGVKAESKQLISDFKGTFNGNGHTIKNYEIEGTSNYLGLFGRVTNKGNINNLVLDNITVTRKSASSSHYVGILIGQNNISDVTVNDITIRNSKINSDVDTTTNNVKYGILAGMAQGTFRNINIEDSNELNVNLKKHQNAFIGGVIGELTSSARLTNVINGGTVTVKVDQTNADKPDEVSKSGLIGKEASVKIGGFAGISSNATIENVITNTKIVVNELEYSIQNNDSEDKEIANVYINIYVGGLFGELSGEFINDMLFTGDITINNKLNLTNNLTETVKDEDDKEVEKEVEHKYTLRLYVGGITAHTSKRATSIENLVRSNGKIVIVEQNTEVEIKLGSLFGSATNFKPITNPRYGFEGTNTDTYNDVALIDVNDPVVSSLTEFFKDNNWMIKNITK